MSDFVGKVVLMQHRFFADQYALALVLKQTNSSVTVVGWAPYKKAWDYEDERRRIYTGPFVVLGSAEDLEPNVIQLTWDRLQSAQAEREQRIKAARETYFQTIKALGEFRGQP